MNNSSYSREPSTIFRNISFLLLGIMQLYSMFVSLVLILTIIIRRNLRTIPNLLTANSGFAIFYYAVNVLAQLILGLQSRDKGKETLCIALSYTTSVGANVICYSYLVTAISQYFFNILYHRRYLLTLRIHWIIVVLSWCISCLLPLFLYFAGALQYAPEMQMCGLTMFVQWSIFLYMGTALGIPFFGIIAIYLRIVRHTRRINTIPTVAQTSGRDLRVLKNILTLVGILGTAGIPSLILVIWNAIPSNMAPVPLYLATVMTISFCTNVQITFIFAMNKNVKALFVGRIQHVFHSFFSI